MSLTGHSPSSYLTVNFIEMPPTSKRKKDQKIGTSPVGQNKSRKVRNSRNREERNAARERIREMEVIFKEKRLKPTVFRML